MDLVDTIMNQGGMTIAQGVKDYLVYLAVDKGYARSTIRANGRHLEQFGDWGASQGATLITDIDLDLIIRYRKFLAAIRKNAAKPWSYTGHYAGPPEQVPIKKNTQSYHLMAVRGLLRYLAIRREMRVLSFEKIVLPKEERALASFLNPEQLAKLLAAPNVKRWGQKRFQWRKGLRDRAILEMFFSTGLRVSELVSLNRDRVDLVRQEFSVMGKGSKVRVVFLSDDARRWLKRYLRTRRDTFKPLFTRDDGVRLTSREVQKIVYIYAKRANLPVKVTPHTLRHTFATDLLRNGADIRSVQEMLGHSSIMTTQRYTHVTNSQLQETHQRFHAKRGIRLGRPPGKRGGLVGPLLP